MVYSLHFKKNEVMIFQIVSASVCLSYLIMSKYLKVGDQCILLDGNVVTLTDATIINAQLEHVDLMSTEKSSLV